jgi:hypothetical protein
MNLRQLGLAALRGRPVAFPCAAALLAVTSLACTSGDGGGLGGPVVPTVLNALAIEGPATVEQGSRVTFKAIVRTYPGGAGTDVSEQAEWSSSNPAVLSIDRGVATGLAEGATTIEIRLKDGGRSARFVTVRGSD